MEQGQGGRTEQHDRERQPSPVERTRRPDGLAPDVGAEPQGALVLLDSLVQQMTAPAREACRPDVEMTRPADPRPSHEPDHLERQHHDGLVVIQTAAETGRPDAEDERERREQEATTKGVDAVAQDQTATAQGELETGDLGRHLGVAGQGIARQGILRQGPVRRCCAHERRVHGPRERGGIARRQGQDVNARGDSIRYRLWLWFSA